VYTMQTLDGIYCI